MQENYKKFQCRNCDYSLWKVVASRQYEPEEVEELLTQRSIGPLQGFRSKMGRPFAAVIKLNDEHQPEFDFGNSEAEGEEPDFSGQEPLGACPKCGGRVFEGPMAYVCEKSVGAMKSCDFRSGKIILQQSIERAQMQKLLETGKTDLLKEFVSARTRRKFSAYLVRGKDGKVGFEFEARAPKAGAGKATSAAETKANAEAVQPVKTKVTRTSKTATGKTSKTAAKKKA
jgi:DNA topoisomerase-3